MYPKLKKSLGQNFLVDKNISRKIISCVTHFRRSKTLVEIGAGSGIMTEPLSGIYEKIYAIEIDKRMTEILNSKFPQGSNVEVFFKDILKLDFNEITNEKIDIFGNIPYYITGPIFLKLFKCKAQIKTIFITIQKELAVRLKSQCGTKDFGFFSCLVQYFTEIEESFDIKRNSFFPAPKVDSTFLALKVKQSILNQEEENKFLGIIKCAFNQRRKTICNALSANSVKGKVLELLKQCEIDSSLRAEDISLDHYIRLARII